MILSLLRQRSVRNWPDPRNRTCQHLCMSIAVAGGGIPVRQSRYARRCIEAPLQFMARSAQGKIALRRFSLKAGGVQGCRRMAIPSGALPPQPRALENVHGC